MTVRYINDDYGTICSYEWLKNGALLVPLPWNFVNIGKGSVRIIQLSALDEGFYQCVATNMYGTAMSNVTFLQRAVLYSHVGGAVIEVYLTEGQPFTLQCRPDKCVPPPSYFWSVADEIVDMSRRSIVTDNRVQIDELGELPILVQDVPAFVVFAAQSRE